MLIEFSVENYRSIKDRAVLSMIAAKLRSSEPSIDVENVIKVDDKLSLIRSALIYGANASGKSNLVKALMFMCEFVADSASDGHADDLIPVEPFFLNQATASAPTRFEIVFLLNGKQYRYGFAADVHRVIAEWLYFVPTTREVELFTRDGQDIHRTTRFKEGHGLEKHTRSNALFLSVAAQLNGEIAGNVTQWFSRNVRLLSTVRDTGYMPYTLSCIKSERYGNRILDLVRQLGLGIRGISVDEVPVPDEVAERLTASSPLGKPYRNVLRTRHAVRESDGSIVDEVDFHGETAESEGTLKAIALLGPLLDVLSNGRVLFIDEIDSRLHPLITSALIRLFNSLDTNSKNAQLVCVTHDTNLLDRRQLRRDQIYFVEKDRLEASHLYSLAEFKISRRTVRNDATFEKDYIEGRYGAIPYIGDIGRLFVEESGRPDEMPVSESVGATAK